MIISHSVPICSKIRLLKIKSKVPLPGITFTRNIILGKSTIFDMRISTGYTISLIICTFVLRLVLFDASHFPYFKVFRVEVRAEIIFNLLI